MLANRLIFFLSKLRIFFLKLILVTPNNINRLTKRIYTIVANELILYVS
jgi:hypothetical protein